MGAPRGKLYRGLILAAVIGGVVGACVLPPEDVQGPCQQDSDCPDDYPCMLEECDTSTGFCKLTPADLQTGDNRCDDDNPCTKEVCSNGSCGHEPQALAFGDTGCDDNNPCTDEICIEGQCAHQTSNTPPSDGNECTIDTCDGGNATHTPVADGTSCGLDGNLKCTNGTCNCTAATECGISTECLKYECTNSECKSTSLEAGTFVDGKDPGDCLKNVCDGANKVITVPDTTDAPPDAVTGNCKKKACDAQGNVIDVDDSTDTPTTDNNECTMEGCNGGTLIDYEPVTDGTDCGAAPTCGLAAGGGYEMVPHDKCMGGACVKGAKMSCGLFKCTGTACSTACASVNDCIQGTYCDGATNSCESIAGTGNPCTMDGQCMTGQCVDGVCCNAVCNGLCERCDNSGSVGICSAILTGQDPDSECPGGDACNGLGACAKPLGAVCTVDSNCLSGICEDGVCCNAQCTGVCKRCDLAGSNGTCTNVAADEEVMGCMMPDVCDGSGSCKSVLGGACVTGTECLSGICEDGVCCGSACAGDCARCDLAGSVGACTNVPMNGQVANCNGNNACDGNNVCKKVNGQSCTNNGACVSGACSDENPNMGGIQGGICCNTTCGGTCESCSAAKTGGTTGTCGFILAKTDPDMECSSGGTLCNTSNGKDCCDGAGVCKP